MYNLWRSKKKVRAINVFQDCMIVLCLLFLPFILSVLFIINLIYEKIKNKKITKEDDFYLPCFIIFIFIIVVIIACCHLGGKNRLKYISFEDFK